MLHLLMQAAADPSPAGEQAALDLLVRGPAEALHDWQEHVEPEAWLADDAPSAQLHRLAVAVLQTLDPPWRGSLAQAMPQALPPGEAGLRLALRNAWLQQAATALALDPARLDTLPPGTATCSLRVLLHHPRTGHGLFGVLQLRLVPASGARLALVAAPGSAFTPCDAHFHGALLRATAWLRAVTDADTTRDLALAWDIHVPGGQLDGLGGPSAGAAVALAGAWLLQHHLQDSEAGLRQALAGIQPWMLAEAGVSAEVVDAQGSTGEVGAVPQKATALHRATQDGGILHLFLHPDDVDELQGHALPRLVLHRVTSVPDLATRLAGSVQPDADRAAVLSCLPLDRPPADPSDDTTPPPAVPAALLQNLAKRGTEVRSLADYALHRWVSWAAQDGGMLHLRFVPLRLAHLDDSPGEGAGTPFKGLADLLGTLRQWPPERHQPTALLLRGVAGAGKSTLLQQHEMGLSLDFLRHWHQRAAGSSTDTVHELPLYVALRSLPATEPDALAWLRRTVAEAYPHCHDLHTLLRGERVHGQPQLRLRLLLDGLNELRVPPGRHRKQRAEQVLAQLADGLRGMLPPLLCARSQHGFDSLVQASGMAVDVQPWDDAHVRQFVDRFFTGQPGQAGKMLAKLAGNPAAQALCHTPFNARHLCNLWQRSDLSTPERAPMHRHLLRQALLRELAIDPLTNQPLNPIFHEDQALLTSTDIDCLLDDTLWGPEGTQPWPTEGALLRLIFDQAAVMQREARSVHQRVSLQQGDLMEVDINHPADASRSVVSGLPASLRQRWRLAVDALGLSAQQRGSGGENLSLDPNWVEYLAAARNPEIDSNQSGPEEFSNREPRAAFDAEQQHPKENLKPDRQKGQNIPDWRGNVAAAERNAPNFTAADREFSDIHPPIWSEEPLGWNLDLLLSLNYHPVVFCGTANSGKSAAITSLISFLMLSGRASVKLGPWPYKASLDDKRMRLKSEDAYFRRVSEFRKGMAPKSDGVAIPTVIPLEIDVFDDAQGAAGSSNSGALVNSIRIAIFDFSGDHLKSHLGEHELALFPGVIETLLRSFPLGISMLYMAPTTRLSGYKGGHSGLEPHESNEGYDLSREDPDAHLANAIRKYISLRPNICARADRHLFVLSKWDLAVPLEHPSFVSPGRHVVEEAIERRFPEAWENYKVMPVPAENKMVQQYCAGIISDRAVMKFSKGAWVRTLLDGYAKTMWNWLYRGATRAPDFPAGLDLFSGNSRSKLSLWQRLFKRSE